MFETQDLNEVRCLIEIKAVELTSITCIFSYSILE